MTTFAKPLTWRMRSDHPQDNQNAVLIADGIGGRYSIEAADAHGWILWWANDEFTFLKCVTLAEAHEATEANWQERVATVLTPSSTRSSGHACSTPPETK